MKIKLSPSIIKFAYHIFDVEASAQTAAADGRMYEYAYVIQKTSALLIGKVLDVGCTVRLNFIPATLLGLG